MMDQKMKMIQETAKQVAEVLAKNGASFSDVSRIFREAEQYMLVSCKHQGDSVLVREPYQRTYSTVSLGSGQESSREAK